jgi:hypothetical protein
VGIVGRRGIDPGGEGDQNQQDQAE